MHLRAPPLILIAILASSPLAADIVHLRSGQQIEGKVRKNLSDGTYTIETSRGRVVKPIDDVLRVEKAPLPATVFDERFADVARGDLDALAELVTFCREKRLLPRKKKVSRLILEIDPHHEMARKELGYIVFENEWILEKELRKKRTELGLVKYHGEWMSPEEKRRRVLDAEREEIDGLFISVRSDNKIVLEYAIRKLMAYDGPHACELFTSYLGDADEHVRLVATSCLSRFPLKKSESTGKYDPRGVSTAKTLYEVFLREPSDRVVEVLLVCLRRFHPDETFRSTLATLRTRTRPEIVARAGRLAEALLLKRRMPDLCRAIVTTRANAGGNIEEVQNKAIHRLLTDTVGVDHGYDIEEWLRWWRKNEWRFRDVP